MFRLCAAKVITVPIEVARPSAVFIEISSLHFGDSIYLKSLATTGTYLLSAASKAKHTDCESDGIKKSSVQGERN